MNVCLKKVRARAGGVRRSPEGAQQESQEGPARAQARHERLPSLQPVHAAEAEGHVPRGEKHGHVQDAGTGETFSSFFFFLSVFTF